MGVPPKIGSLTIYGGELARMLMSVIQGPVVQSIISLMSSLRGQLVKCFMTL